MYYHYNQWSINNEFKLSENQRKFNSVLKTIGLKAKNIRVNNNVYYGFEIDLKTISQHINLNK